MFPYVLTSLTECQGKKWGRSSGKIPGKSIKKNKRLAHHHFCSACFWDPNEHSWKHGSHISQFIQKGRFYWETFVYRNYIRIHFKPQQLLIILAGITRRFGTSKCRVDSGTITLNKHNRGGGKEGGTLQASSSLPRTLPHHSSFSFRHRLVHVYSSQRDIYDTMVHILHISVHYNIFTFFFLWQCKFQSSTPS